MSPDTSGVEDPERRWRSVPSEVPLQNEQKQTPRINLRRLNEKLMFDTHKCGDQYRLCNGVSYQVIASVEER